jgi:ADP-heptose:LPS heptosyltransferase
VNSVRNYNNMKKKILIIRLGAIGDVIRTMPVLEHLSKKYPSYKIDWLVEDRASNILLDSTLLNEIIIVPRKEITNTLNQKKFFKLFFILKKLIKYIQSKDYFIIYDFHGIFKSGFFSFFSTAPVRIGFSRKFTKEFNYLFNNKYFSPASKYVTRIEKNFSLLGMNIEKNKKLNWNIYISDADKEYVDEWLKNKNLLNKKIIGVNPFVSAAGRYKEWFLDFYAKLIELIKDNYPALEVVVTYGPGEEEKMKYIIEKSGVNVFPAPATTMKQLAYLISKFELFITGDTGPMHLAEAMGTDIAAIFGPSDVNINRPFTGNSIVIYKESGCNPCRNKKCQDLKCLKILSPEFVFEEIQKNKLF